MTSVSLSQIYVYPVKSLAGFSTDRWPIDDRGLRYDRRWMLVDEHQKFLSQRRLPKMALIKTQLTANELTLSIPDGKEIALPLNPESGDPIEVDIWNDRCLAHRISPKTDQWLSDFLDSPCQLVYQPDESHRPVDPAYANETDQAAFSDGFPFLIVSQASLQSLNQAMQLELAMTRFRPNLVVNGCEAYAEDSWREIRINGINFRLPKPCSRCAVPTIDPETGIAGKEPLTTLNRLRKWDNKVYFGQNALHNSKGNIAIGDSIQIVSTGSKQPPL